MRLSHLAILTALLLPACAEPTPEAPDLAAELLGSWREVDHASDTPQPEAERDTLTFAADGQLTQVLDGESQTGPWSVVGDRLTLEIQEPNETLTIENTIAIVDGRLLMAVATPAGAVAGPVGTWNSQILINTRTLERTLVLGSDGAATLREQVDAEEPFEGTGTWTESAPGQIEIRIPIGSNTTLSIDAFVRGDRLGFGEYEPI